MCVNDCEWCVCMYWDSDGLARCVSCQQLKHCLSLVSLHLQQLVLEVHLQQFNTAIYT